MDDMAGVDLKYIGGNCPVQAEGTVDGKEFYFRARGASWRLEIGGEMVVAPEWKYEENYGDGPYDAGWMELSEALAFIAKAVALYRSPAVTSEPAKTGERG